MVLVYLERFFTIITNKNKINNKNKKRDIICGRRICTMIMIMMMMMMILLLPNNNNNSNNNNNLNLKVVDAAIVNGNGNGKEEEEGEGIILDLDVEKNSLHQEKLNRSVDFLYNQLINLSDTGIYEHTLFIEAIERPRSSMGIYHEMVYFDMLLKSDFFQSGQSIEKFECIVMYNYNDNIMNFAINEFPIMLDDEIEKYHILKIEKARQKREDLFHEIEVEIGGKEEEGKEEEEMEINRSSNNDSTMKKKKNRINGRSFISEEL